MKRQISPVIGAMIGIAIFAVFLAVAPFSRGFAASQSYFSVLPDVPMMTGMEEIEGQTFVFDKAEGRVIETAGFLPQNTPEKAQEYYSEVLLQLGWKPLKTGVFTRDSEQMVVIARKVEGGVLVKFFLAPLSR